MKYLVRFARDLSEYADVEIEAESSDQAEEIAEQQYDDGDLPNLHWYLGEDREDAYVAYSEEIK